MRWWKPKPAPLVLQGEATLRVGDRELTLVYNYAATKAIDKVLGRPWSSSPGELTHARAFLWAALRARHPEITLEAAGEIFDEVGLDAVLEACDRANKNWTKALDAAKSGRRK